MSDGGFRNVIIESGFETSTKLPLFVLPVLHGIKPNVCYEEKHNFLLAYAFYLHSCNTSELRNEFLLIYTHHWDSKSL